MGTASRVCAVILAVCHLAACTPVTTSKALNIHSAADMRHIPVKEGQIYRVVFRNGTEEQVVGTALILEQQAVLIYSPGEERWRRFAAVDIDEIYLERTDNVKKSNRAALITGAAVLAAFAAAAAGGYYLEKTMK